MCARGRSLKKGKKGISFLQNHKVRFGSLRRKGKIKDEFENFSVRDLQIFYIHFDNEHGQRRG
jgi:hypothetical protein